MRVLSYAPGPLQTDMYEEICDTCGNQEIAETFKASKQQISTIIIWLAPRAGKMSQILRCDWLPERARWSYLARSGLPVARPLGIESFIIPTTMRVSSIFSLFWGKTLTEKFGKLSTFT